MNPHIRSVVFIPSCLTLAAVVTMNYKQGFAQIPPTPNIPSQTPSISKHSAAAAISSITNQHLHSIVLLNQDLAVIKSQLQDTDETYSLESSSGEDNGVANGNNMVHTHTVTLSRDQLSQLLDNGELQVESEPTLDHTHIFQFIRSQDCPPLVVPVHSPMPEMSAIPPSPVVISESPTPMARSSAHTIGKKGSATAPRPLIPNAPVTPVPDNTSN